MNWTHDEWLAQRNYPKDFPDLMVAWSLKGEMELERVFTGKLRDEEVSGCSKSFPDLGRMPGDNEEQDLDALLGSLCDWWTLWKKK